VSDRGGSEKPRAAEKNAEKKAEKEAVKGRLPRGLEATLRIAMRDGTDWHPRLQQAVAVLTGQ